MPTIKKNMMTTLANAHYVEALARGFPRFLGKISDSNPLNAAPYVCSYDDLLKDFRKFPGRENLLRQLSDVLGEVRDKGLSIESMLLGGSFIDVENESPKDLDCVIFYRCTEKCALVDIRAIAEAQNEARRRGIDARFIPSDTDPILFVKAVSYFTVLYTASKPERKPALGPLLVDCR
jgi:hypothetical protein